MNLIVNKPFNYNRLLVIIVLLRQYLLYHLNNDKLLLAEKYINENLKPDNIDEINAKQICLLAVGNLRLIESQYDYSIEIDRTLTYPGTKLKIVDLCRLINYGALTVPAYPIFEQMFEYGKTIL